MPYKALTHPYHIRALYRRFILIGRAFEHNRFLQYSRRCHLTQTLPPQIDELFHIFYSHNKPSPSQTRSIVRKEIGEAIIQTARHSFRKPRGLQTIQSLERHPHSTISERDIDKLFIIGIRTLYFLERSCGLRPYAFHYQPTSSPIFGTHHHIIPLTSDPSSFHTLPRQTQIVFTKLSQYFQTHQNGLLSTPQQRALFIQSLPQHIQDTINQIRIPASSPYPSSATHRVTSGFSGGGSATTSSLATTRHPPELNTLHTLTRLRVNSKQRHNIRGSLLTSSQELSPQHIAQILSRLKIALWL